MQRSEIVAQVRFSTMKTSGDITDEEIEALIDLCMSEISVASWWTFLQASDTITTVASQANYALPTDFLYGVALIDDDNDGRVEYIAPELYFDRYGNNTGNESATADFWTIWEGDILLSPTPSDADTDRYTFRYYRTITALTADSHVPEFHEAFHYGIVEYCKWKIWEREEFFQQSAAARTGFYTTLELMRKWYASPTSRTPWIGGDGTALRRGDPNIPSLWRL